MPELNNQPPLPIQPEEDIRSTSHTETSWEDKEFLDRRNFNDLKNTAEHYLGNTLALAVGYGEMAVTHPKFPQDADHRMVAQSVTRSFARIGVVLGTLSSLEYDTPIKKSGGQFIFDIDKEMNSRLESEGINSQPELMSDNWEDKEVPDRYDVYKNTIDHYARNAVSVPRGYYEVLEEELRGAPEVLKLIQSSYLGTLRATATIDVMSKMPKDTERSTEAEKTHYALDDQIEARFIELQATYQQHRKPD